jgi:hypothetical protein
LPKGLSKNNASPGPSGPLGEAKPSYVFFNNARMTQDALRFQAITEET